MLECFKGEVPLDGCLEDPLEGCGEDPNEDNRDPLGDDPTAEKRQSYDVEREGDGAL